MNRKKILILGGSSFVGFNLSFLLSKKNLVTSTYFNNKPIIKKKNSNLKFIKVNLTKTILLKGNYDLVICCAYKTESNHKNNLKLKQTNQRITKNIIKYLDRKKIKMLVFLSSMIVYKDVNHKSLSERSRLNYKNYYALSKINDEKAFIKWSKNTSERRECLILRLPGVVGKGIGSNFINHLIKTLRNHEEVKLYNSNFYFNNIVHVDTIADYIQQYFSCKNKKCLILNFGSKQKLKVITIARYLKKKLKSHSKIIDYGKNNRSFTIDISRAIQNKYFPLSVRECLDKI